MGTLGKSVRDTHGSELVVGGIDVKSVEKTGMWCWQAQVLMQTTFTLLR